MIEAREVLRYEEIKEQIWSAPETWAPGLLAVLIARCKADGIFKDDKSLVDFAASAFETADIDSEDNSDAK